MTTNSNKQLLIIGDSGVYGWGDPYGGGWAERLRQHWLSLPSAPVIYPLGIRGDGLEKVARRWKQEWLVRGELRRNLPKAILLSIGLNDTARVGRPDGRPQLTSEAFRFGLYQLLKDMSACTKVMVMGLTPVNEVAMPFADCLWYANSYGAIYESQIEEVCLEINIPYLSLHKDLLAEPQLNLWLEPDGIHLNSDGHNWMYKRINSWSPLLDWAQLEKIENKTPLFN